MAQESALAGALGREARRLRTASLSPTPSHSQGTPDPVPTRLNHKSNTGAFSLPPILKTVGLGRDSPFTRGWPGRLRHSESFRTMWQL